jgi:hypothetical protein
MIEAYSLKLRQKFYYIHIFHTYSTIIPAETYPSTTSGTSTRADVSVRSPQFNKKDIPTAVVTGGKPIVVLFIVYM